MAVRVGDRPWVLGLLVVQAVGLMLRAKGPLNTLPYDIVATLYAGAVLVMLTAATMSAMKAMLTLRALARESSVSAA